MSRQGRRAVGIFFVFMLLHQSDKLLIGPLTTPIMETFGVDEAQMGAVVTGSLLVGSVLYPAWGYLYDRFARARPLALAALIWGSTTWLAALAPTFPIFWAARATTGIDDSSYPGLWSLVADYVGPLRRGRVSGLLQLTSPLGYLGGMVLAFTLGSALGWRSVLYVTGGLGVLLAAAIWLGVREPPRGQAEPELQDLADLGVYRFSWPAARGLLHKRSLRLMLLQGFFGAFPWNVVAYWFFRYLETERGYGEGAILATMAAAVAAMSAGYVAGGALGDAAFRRNPRGRVGVAAASTLAGAAVLVVTLSIPPGQPVLFAGLLCLTGFFMPFASANVVATVYDVTAPEVRSTAMALQSFVEETGAALAPLIAGLIAVRASLHVAILLLSVSAWLLCAAVFGLAAHRLPEDVRALRELLRARAAEGHRAEARAVTERAANSA